MYSIEARMTISSAIVPLATTTFCDLPPETIRIIFGYHFAFNDLGFATEYEYRHDLNRSKATLTTVIGRHVCVYFRDVLSSGPRFKNVSVLAASVNELKIVKWAISYGYYPSDGALICSWAAFYDNDKMLEWAQSRGYSVTAVAASGAALGGHLEMFKKVLGCRHIKLDATVFENAIIGGCIPILDYIFRCQQRLYHTSCIDAVNVNEIIKKSPIASLLWAVLKGIGNLGAWVFELSIVHNRVDFMEHMLANGLHHLIPQPNIISANTLHIVTHATPEMIDLLISKHVITGNLIDGIFNCAIGAGRVVLYRHMYPKWITLAAVMPISLIETCNTPAIMFCRENGVAWPADALRTIIMKDIRDNVQHAATADLTWQTNKKLIEFMIENDCQLTPELPQLYADAGMYDIAEWLRGLVLPK